LCHEHGSAAGNRIVPARSDERAAEALAAVPGAQGPVVGDLSSIQATCAVAEQVNRLGAFDAVIHNAGIGYRERGRGDTVDGLPSVFAVNTLAPYILTMRIHRPRRLVYLSSGMHRGAAVNLTDLTWRTRHWNGSSAYAESKLHDVILAFAVARMWPEVLSNALEPGWVPTKMGGPGAPDDMDAAPRTQVWLATSDDAQALVSGQYFYHLQRRSAHPAASDPDVQRRLLAACAQISGVPIPH